MNTKYDTGNVIRNAVNDFSQFAFPAELPTEEWAGNEVRSYQNYIRPVSNLFENDRENAGFIKDVYKSFNPENEYAVIFGCDVEQTGTYYEVKHGAFIYNGRIYYVFPACNAVAKQIESEYQVAGLGELKLTITYDYDSGIYSYVSSIPVEDSLTGTAANAVTLINKLLTNLFVYIPEGETTPIPINNVPSIESHIILPIFSTTTYPQKIFFNGSIFKMNADVDANSIIFANIESSTSVVNSVKTYSTIDGSRINAATISNASLENPKFYLGNVEINLGETKTELSGINKLNDIHIAVENSKLNIVYSSLASGASQASSIYSIIADTNYELKDACTKAYSTDSTLSVPEGDKLPTASAVKTFVINQINSQTRSSNIGFGNGITVSSGVASFADNVNLASSAKLVLDSEANASRDALGVLSSSASIYTKGGVEVEKDIYSNGNIVGLNSGTYSSRKLKENITPFKKSAVKLINDVKIVNYNYIADPDKNHKVGFIADDTDVNIHQRLYIMPLLIVRRPLFRSRRRPSRCVSGNSL